MKTSQEHLFAVKRTARVYTFGNLSQTTKRIWVVAHGYAQLGKYFIKHFEHLDADENYIIAPEALSKGYIAGMSGRVGASWMTKEMREEEIFNYLNYIDQITYELLQNIDYSKMKIIALGFSQGAATISRWVQKSKLNVNLLCFWAGQPAIELFSSNNYNKLAILYVVGNKDPYFSEEVKIKLKQKSKDCRWTFKLLSFEGEHHLNKEMLIKIEDNSF